MKTFKVRRLVSAAAKCAFLTTLITNLGLCPSEAADSKKLTYVIVHGAFSGGWDWKEVGEILTARGHTVYRPTLTGLGERVHLAGPEINLTTHITDVVNVIKYESLSNVVLCGHSYAGMVLTGVMDRIPERLRHVIFMDAVLPNDGESFVSLGEAGGDPFPEKEKEESALKGYSSPSWLNFNKPPPSEVPHPWKTFTEPVSFKNPVAKQLSATLIFFLDKEQKPEVLDKNNKDSVWRHMHWQRATARGWTIEKLKGPHVAEKTHPKELAALLDQIPAKSVKNGP